MIELKTKLAGYYKIEVGRPDGSRKVVADWFPNLITDAGLEMIGTDVDWLSYCQVGTGSTAPDFTDVGLANYLAGSDLSSPGPSKGVVGSSPYYCFYTKTYPFAAGVATGNLSEVGVGRTRTTGNLFSRALILDSGGSPTTITVLSDETLYVTYSLRRYMPLVDTTGTVDLRGVTHTFTGRASLVTSATSWILPFYSLSPGSGGFTNCTVYDGAIGAITSYPSGANAYTSTVSQAAYTPGSYSTSWTYSFSLTQGNLAGFISAITINLCGGYYQFGITPDIEKTSDDIMSLTFQCSWGRV